MTKLFGALASHFSATPVLLLVVLLNVLMASIFVYTLHEANAAANRQTELLEKCLLRR